MFVICCIDDPKQFFFYKCTNVRIKTEIIFVKNIYLPNTICSVHYFKLLLDLKKYGYWSIWNI